MPETAKVPRPFTMHWGSGLITEEARVAGEYHVPAIQLMEYSEGEAIGSWSIRFCSFNHRGQFQRSPLMINEEDINAMRQAGLLNGTIRWLQTKPRKAQSGYPGGWGTPNVKDPVTSSPESWRVTSGAI